MLTLLPGGTESFHGFLHVSPVDVDPTLIDSYMPITQLETPAYIYLFKVND